MSRTKHEAARGSAWAAAACLAFVAAPALAAAPSFYVTDSTRKIRPGDAPLSTATSAHLWAARNEFEAFQLVVAGPATGVTISAAADLTGPGTLSAAQLVRFFREGYVDLAKKSAGDGWTGRTPDVMLPDVDDVVGEQRRGGSSSGFPFDVPAGENRVIFVEVLVPSGAAAGDYVTTLTLSSAGGAASVPVTLTVWDFTLPATSSLRSAYQLNYAGIPSAHGITSYGADFSKLRARYSQLGLDHRMSIGAIDDGNNSISNFETYYAPLVGGTSPARLSGARLTTVQYMGQGTYQEWMDFFATKGWPDLLYQYTCDEPDSAYCKWGDIAGRVAPARAAGMRTLTTTQIQDADAHGVTSLIDIIVPVINYMDDKPGYGSKYEGDQSSKYSAFTATGDKKELWIYQSCMSHGCGGEDGSSWNTYFNGWATLMADAASIRSRAQEWFAFRWGATGELYYEVVQNFTDANTPWTTLYNEFTGNGDGTLFYPGTPVRIGGTTHIPVASLRMKMIREGQEDFEYLKLCADLGDPAFAMTTAATLFPHPYQVEPPVDQLYAARAALAQRILQLAHPNQPCSDGTQQGQCSATKPAKCVGGALVASCGSCGCPGADEQCQADGTCKAALGYSATGLPAPATVDANLVEFEGLPSIDLKGASASAKVSAGWDAQALYLAFDVVDDYLVAASGAEGDLWDGDGVEVMLDTAMDGGASADTDDFHFIVTAGGQLADSRSWTDFAFASGSAQAVDLEGATLPGSSVGPGYRVELKVPWAAIGVTPGVGTKLGFDVALDDRDSSGGTASVDFAGLAKFNAPSSWAVLTLAAGPSADAGAPPADAGPPPASDSGVAPGADAAPAGADDAAAAGPDAGSTASADGGATVPDASNLPPQPVDGACGCSSTAGGLSLAGWLLGLGAVLRRRPSR